MKFLQVYCEKRAMAVYINLQKIVMITKTAETNDVCFIEVEGLNDSLGAIEVKKPAEELIRMIHGEDKAAIGFRTNR